MNTIIKPYIKENSKLDKAFFNYYKILDKEMPYKFSYLDEWILKKSKKLLEEIDRIESNKEQLYRVYKRGSIVKVDFGVGLGSEMSQVHFAIVINNYDSNKNNVLTVIPLTSKKGKYTLDLGELIYDKIIKKIKDELLSLGSIEEKNEEEKFITESISKKLNTLLSYYKSNMKNTYACCNLITTISKTRIIPPINEYDKIGRVKCSAEVMDKIDGAIFNQFTKI